MPPSPTPSPIKPPALSRGDKVGIVAPASNIKSEQLKTGCERLRQMGYEPFYFENVVEQDLYFAGSVDRRLNELHEMFARDEIRAILCARGGYGCNYLLPGLDLDLIRRRPKLLVGYSDNTALLTWIHDATGLITCHGPMLAKDFAVANGIDEAAWNAVTTGIGNWELASYACFGFSPLLAGHAEGKLYGGCLSILVASLGTPFEIQTDGTLLFLEDVNAKPYQIDRMLMQLKLAGKLRGVRGIIFGEMMDCVQAPEQPYTLQEIVRRIVSDLGVPVAYGLRSGHVSRENITLPLGVHASLAVTQESVRLDITESATLRAAATIHSA